MQYDWTELVLTTDFKLEYRPMRSKPKAVGNNPKKDRREVSKGYKAGPVKGYHTGKGK